MIVASGPWPEPGIGIDARQVCIRNCDEKIERRDRTRLSTRDIEAVGSRHLTGARPTVVGDRCQPSLGGLAGGHFEPQVIRDDTCLSMVGTTIHARVSTISVSRATAILPSPASGIQV
jgi:hypothetical protein